MQLHYGAKRDNNSTIFNLLGPDTGVDCINNYAPAAELANFLNALEGTKELPKMIIYSRKSITIIQTFVRWRILRMNIG